MCLIENSKSGTQVAAVLMSSIRSSSGSAFPSPVYPNSMTAAFFFSFVRCVLCIALKKCQEQMNPRTLGCINCSLHVESLWVCLKVCGRAALFCDLWFYCSPVCCCLLHIASPLLLFFLQIVLRPA